MTAQAHRAIRHREERGRARSGRWPLESTLKESKVPGLHEITAMSTLQRAIELAVNAHAGQEDLPGEPYITHPMRVMLALADSGEDELRMVGILHDAVERGTLAMVDLQREGFSKAVITGVALMTHDDHVSYADYVVALKRHPLARRVKMADLTDNADLRHVDMRPAKFRKDRMRATRYILSYRFLADELDEKTYRRLMDEAESDVAKGGK